MKFIDIDKRGMFEDNDLEFKLTLNRNNPISWVKTICAFANGKGGTIVVGVDDLGNIKGLEKREVDESKNLVNELCDRMIRPGNFRPRFEERLLGDSKYLLFVYVLPTRSIAYVREGDHREIVYVRHDGQTVPAGMEELYALMRKRQYAEFDLESGQIPFEESSFHELERKASLEKGREIKVDKDLALSLNLIDEEGFLTLCGELFRDGCNHKNANVHFRTWPGFHRGGGVVYDDFEAKGNLLSLYSSMSDYVKKAARRGYVKTFPGHSAISPYPEKALHEAFVNALAHRDYSINGSQIDFDVYLDRLDIGVPGSFLPTGEAPFGTVKRMRSKKRNSAICDVFAFLGMMEKSGQGFDNIALSYMPYPEEYAPRYQSFPDYFLLTLPDLSLANEGITTSSVELSYHRLQGGVREYDDAVLLSCYRSQKSSSELLSLTPYKSKASLLNNVINPLVDAGLLLPSSSTNSPTTKYSTNRETVYLTPKNL